MNRCFAGEGIQTQATREHMTRCAAPLAIKKMQVKATMRFHYMPITMAKIGNSETTKFWQGCGETGSPIHC